MAREAGISPRSCPSAALSHEPREPACVVEIVSRGSSAVGACSAVVVEPCTTFARPLWPREGYQTPQRVVHRRRVAEHGGDVRMKQNDVGALSVAFVILAPHRSGEVVFGKELVVLLTAARSEPS